MKQNKFWDFISSKAFYMSLVSGVLIIAVVALVMSLNGSGPNAAETEENNGYVAVEDIPSYSEPEIAAANKSNTAPLKTYEEYSNSELRQSYASATMPGQSSAEARAQAEIAKNQAGATAAGVSDTAASQEAVEKAIAEVAEAKEQLANEPEPVAAQPADEIAVISETPDEAEEVVPTFTDFTDSSKMSWPVVGEIIMDFSSNHLIYDKTLDQYKTNNTLCIASPAGSQVKSAATGKVKEVKDDHVTGVTVVIDHGNGWLTTYGQLQKNVLVEQDQIVKAGQVIGGIDAPTKYGVLLGEHLSFAVTRDNKPYDPKTILVN